MTQPQQPTGNAAQQVSVPQAPPPPTADTESLVPVILGVIAAYMVTKTLLSQPWTAIARDLKIMQLGGNVIEMIARRSVERMRREARGKTGNDLIPHIEDAVQVAVEAGVRSIVDMVRSMPVPGQSLQARDPGAPPADGRRPPVARPRTAAEESRIVETRSNGPVRRDLDTAVGEETALVDPDGDGEYELAPVQRESRILSPKHARRAGEDIALTIRYTVMNEVAALTGWRKEWRTQPDGRVRPTHRALNGVMVPAKSSFRIDARTSIRYPHDPQAPTHEIAGCRCVVFYRR